MATAQTVPSAHASAHASAPSDLRVQAHFDTHVTQYVDKTLEIYREASRERLRILERVMQVDPSTPLRLLDIGCGGGSFMDTFLSHFSEATACGVDLSSNMLAENTLSPRKDLQQANALQLPAQIGEFDVINIDTVMHHLICGRSYDGTRRQISSFLQSLHRFLTPGGVIMVREIFHEYTGIETLASRIIFQVSTLSLPAAVARLLHKLGLQAANAGVCFLSRKQWLQAFRESGFHVAEAREWAWTSQPYRSIGFKASGDIHYILMPQRPEV